MTEPEIAIYLEGRFHPWQRRQVERHLTNCPVCTQEVGEAFRLLRSGKLLPPASLYHPLEQWLSELMRLLPLPPWAWHAGLSALTPFLWWLLGLPSRVPWLQEWHAQLIAWLAVWAATTHYVYLQSQLRQFHRLLWESGLDAGEIEGFQQRYLAPMQGWWSFRWPGKRRGEVLLPAGWTLLGLTLLAEGLNQWVQPGARGALADVAARSIGFYNLLAATATGVGWLLGARYLIGLGRFLWRWPVPAAARERVREALRRIVHRWIIVCGGCGAWAMGWSARQIGHWPHPWVEMYSIALLCFLLAHQWLTWQALDVPGRRLLARWQAAVEGGLALAAALSGAVLAWV